MYSSLWMLLANGYLCSENFYMYDATLYICSCPSVLTRPHFSPPPYYVRLLFPALLIQHSATGMIILSNYSGDHRGI